MNRETSKSSLCNYVSCESSATSFKDSFDMQKNKLNSMNGLRIKPMKRSASRAPPPLPSLSDLWRCCWLFVHHYRVSGDQFAYQKWVTSPERARPCIRVRAAKKKKKKIIIKNQGVWGMDKRCCLCWCTTLTWKHPRFVHRWHHQVIITKETRW